MNPTTNETTPTGDPAVRQNVIKGLAIVGFVALVVAGITLAIYLGRYIPKAVNGLGSAAVSLSQVFSPAPSTPVATTTATSTATTTPVVTSSTTPAGGTTPIVVGTNPSGLPGIIPIPVPVITPGPTTQHTYPIGTGGTTGGTGTSTTTPIPVTLHGLPDLTTHIIATGYMTSTSTTSFVASSTIPHGARVAVKFSIRNDGTNVTGPWSFTASIPTQTNFVFESPVQQSLRPGEHIDYILGFDQAVPGTNQPISITADAKHQVAESNENNNSASANVKILGQ
ncbi:MAG TPA: CARDB domain-containing protein [Candidatus Paceibacterota bacterium]